MAQNGISYDGRIVAKNKPIRHTVTDNGLHILNLTIAEQHSMKKSAAKRNPAMKQYVDAERAQSKTDDDYIDTTVTWHSLTIMGEKAEDLAQNHELNHGALVVISDASYTEDAPWKDDQGVERARRSETIGDKKGGLVVKFAPRDPMPPVWDGMSEVAKAGGGGSGPAREYEEPSGF